MRFSSLTILPVICSLIVYAPASLCDNNPSNTTRSTPKLYGRIEQIVQGSGAQFPVELKAQTAQMDTRKLPVRQQRASTSVSNLSGTVIRSFPQQWSGTWGGNLKIWTTQADPVYWQIDPDEANQMRSIFLPGLTGSVNFNFSQDSSGKIDLAPAQVVFMVPMKKTHAQQELNGLLAGGGLGQATGMTLPGMDSKQLAGMMQQMANSMNVPVALGFGALNSSGGMEGISGNSINATVLTNNIRQLGPRILEQQIVSKEMERNNKTGKTREEYSETVIRFTSQDANDLYVQTASVNYTADRKFERKIILYGSVRRGQVMPDMITNPLGGLMGPGGGSQLPQLPGGQNPFQGLFPH